ncbi:hypothetical protein HRO22_000753 [Vibrio vulnificus]|nr:hypothetical protein [Vibrio vulnificus]
MPIRFDDEGRVCLNDLHKASGGHRKHQPALWLRNDQTRALIEEFDGSPDERVANLQPANMKHGLNSANSQSLSMGSEIKGADLHLLPEGSEIDRSTDLYTVPMGSDFKYTDLYIYPKPAVKVVEGKYGGTWIIKPLVYSYAMWVSPKFHRMVCEMLQAMDEGRLSLHSAPAETEFDKKLELVTKLGAQFNLGKNEQLEMLRSTIEGYGLVVPHVIETNSELDTSIPQPKRPAAKTDWAWVLKQYFEMLNNLEVNKATHPYAFEEGLFLTRTSYIINCLYQNKKVWARMARHGLTSDRLLKRWCKAQGVVVQDGKEKSIQARRVANCCCFSLQALSELGIEL